MLNKTLLEDILNGKKVVERSEMIKLFGSFIPQDLTDTKDVLAKFNKKSETMEQQQENLKYAISYLKEKVKKENLEKIKDFSDEELELYGLRRIKD